MQHIKTELLNYLKPLCRMKQLNKYATALPFIGALLMLCFEAQPGPYYLARQLCITVPAIGLLIWTAVLSHKNLNNNEDVP